MEICMKRPSRRRRSIAFLPVVCLVSLLLASSLKAHGAPTVTSISPNPVAAGGQLTINGSGFGTSQGNGFVTLQNVHGTVTTWSNTQIVVTVPTNVVAGFLYVQANGVDSNSVPF